MAFTLPPLPYAYDALEPAIDKETMTFHHDKHHQTYVDNLNKAVDADASLQGKSLEELFASISAAPKAVRNNGGGHWNHALFWELLAPAGQGGQPSAELSAAIERDLGGLDAFKEAFNAAGAGQFGSGLGLADRPGRQAEGHLDAQPGQPPDGRRRAKGRCRAGRRRLGARLLSEIPEPPGRLSEGFLGGGELEQGQRPLRRRHDLIGLI
jgi:hypothetical protein